MALYIGDELIAGDVEGQKINNPFSLLDYKYSEYELSNTSWLLSNGQWNSGAVYQSVYDLLLQIYNGTVTKAGVSVKLSTEAYADTDFVLNTGDTTFRLPIKVLMAGSKRVAGNGKALGLTAGTNKNLALTGSTTSAYIFGATGAYGTNVGGTATITNNYAGAYGVTTDPTKSGIETSSTGLYLYFYVGETIQDANIIAAASVLTDVADLKAHSIVETYVNGTSWYRVWSDGYCEQWGNYITNGVATWFTVNFSKVFANVNYNISTTPVRANANLIPVAIPVQVSVNNMQVACGDATGSFYWFVCGYIS